MTLENLYTMLYNCGIGQKGYYICLCLDWNFVEHQPFSNFVLIMIIKLFDSVSVDLIQQFP